MDDIIRWNSALEAESIRLSFSDTNQNQTIAIQNADGKRALIDFSGPEVTFDGDLPMSEAAQIFFRCVKGYFDISAQMKEPPR